MTTYRVAVIGHTGRGNYGHGLDVVWQSFPECTLVGVADADPAGLTKATRALSAPASFADYREMLDKTRPDIVSIGPRWLDQHCDMVLAAAERKIHVYLEKPLCRDLQEADRMVAACEQHRIKLAMAHQTRYSPKLRVVRDLIDDGRIGEVLEYRGRGKEDQRGGGEDLWVLGSHVMNLIRYFAGEPQWCFASVMQDEQPLTREQVRSGNEGIGPLGGDTVHVMYGGLPSNALATFDSRRNANGGRFGLQIYGSQGVIEILTGALPDAYLLDDPAWSPGRSGKSWRAISSQGLGQPETLPPMGLGEGNVLAVRDLIEAIEQNRQPECSVYEGRHTIEMIAAVFESHRQQRPVSLPLESRQNPLDLL